MPLIKHLESIIVEIKVNCPRYLMLEISNTLLHWYILIDLNKISQFSQNIRTHFM